jgi:hypothetical protein
LKKRHCGICEDLTTNEDKCTPCEIHSERIDKEIKRRLKNKKEDLKRWRKQN